MLHKLEEKKTKEEKAEYFDLKQKNKIKSSIYQKMSIELQREQKSFNSEEKQQNKKKKCFMSLIIFINL